MREDEVMIKAEGGDVMMEVKVRGMHGHEPRNEGNF